MKVLHQNPPVVTQWVMTLITPKNIRSLDIEAVKKDLFELMTGFTRLVASGLRSNTFRFTEWLGTALVPTESVMVAVELERVQ